MQAKITPERIDAVLAEARSLLRHERENRNRRALVEIVEHLRQRYRHDGAHCRHYREKLINTRDTTGVYCKDCLNFFEGADLEDFPEMGEK